MTKEMPTFPKSVKEVYLFRLSGHLKVNLTPREQEASYLSSQVLTRFRIFSWSTSVPRKPFSRSSRTPPSYWKVLTPPGSISSTRLARCSVWELLSEDLP